MTHWSTLERPLLAASLLLCGLRPALAERPSCSPLVIEADSAVSTRWP